MDERVTKRKYKFADQAKLPFYFVSAADVTNVFQIFDDTLRIAIDYKANPPTGDFMN